MLSLTPKSSVLVVFTSARFPIVELKPLRRGIKHFFVACGEANVLQLVLFHVLVTHFSTRLVNLQKKMVLTAAAESLTIQEKPSMPFEPTKIKGEVNVVYKPTLQKNLQMRNEEDDKKTTKKDSNKTGVLKSRKMARTSS